MKMRNETRVEVMMHVSLLPLSAYVNWKLELKCGGFPSIADLLRKPALVFHEVRPKTNKIQY